MAGGFSVVDYEGAERTDSAKSDLLRVELADLLGCENVGLRVWYLEPGESIVYHRHREQEEVYLPLSGPGRMRIDGERLTVGEGEAVRVPPETPRGMVNDDDRRHVWLAIGAPPVEDDGIYEDDPAW